MAAFAPIVHKQGEPSMRRITLGLLMGVALVAMFGCGGDVVKTVTSDAALEARVMGAITADPAMTGRMVDQLLASEPARAVLLEKLMANGDAVQTVMTQFAKDETRIDGILSLAVQDSSMKAHVMTLLKGMQMGAKK
jgi:hypothetical protein